MPATRNNRTAVTGTRLAPRKTASSRNRTAFVDPGTSTEQSWRKEAECLKHDPDLWFSDNAHSAEYAIEICHTCPVLAKCLGWAMETRQSYGIWGGVDFDGPAKPWHAKRKH